jgi:predicted small lipoprotein YifL
MSRVLAILALAALAACGVDGEPVPPPVAKPAPGTVTVTVEGVAEIGVVGKS